MSENVDLLRSIFSNWERGDFSSTAWAHPALEWVMADGPTPGNWTGIAGMREGWAKFRSVWAEYHFAAQNYRELDSERVLVLGRFTGRRNANGADREQTRA